MLPLHPYNKQKSEEPKKEQLFLDSLENWSPRVEIGRNIGDHNLYGSRKYQRVNDRVGSPKLQLIDCQRIKVDNFELKSRRIQSQGTLIFCDILHWIFSPFLTINIGKIIFCFWQEERKKTILKYTKALYSEKILPLRGVILYLTTWEKRTL